MTFLKTTTVDKLPNDLEGMEASMERLLALIDDVYKYVDDVVEGRVAPDNNIGKFISDTVASIPKISPPAFDKLVNDSLQDQLLLLYLSSITRTQLSLAEKLNTAAQILPVDFSLASADCCYAITRSRVAKNGYQTRVYDGYGVIALSRTL
ncbi:eukaryotic translation initiation factor 2 [Actinidia rufa]|uniref:Eukaryotic translation initiation factor 2 n=1 Tax=Actinidia rufa TaxID=165716 RepID=A0A7J0GW69_9ERIC|nr:eukaryotic translation initiation factor 2 [Actinidia rufa]